jgi:hypothetical protein
MSKVQERIRPQLKAKELAEFLLRDPDALVFASGSLLNLDEPEETQEFIDWEEKIKVVAVEHSYEGFTIGWEGGILR